MIAGQDKELKLLDKASREFAKKELAPNREENDKYPFGPFFEPALGADDLLKRTVADKPDAKNALIAFPAFNNPAEIENAASVVKRGDAYALSGRIEYVVLAGIAGHALVPGKIAGQAGYSFFLIRLSDAGVEKSGPIPSLGIHACPAADLTLHNVDGVLVGAEGEGSRYFEHMSDRLHAAAGAMSAGIMKGSFLEAFEYAKKRQQGGRQIIHWSEVRMILSGMAVAVSASEMMVSRACQAIDTSEKGWQTASRAAGITIAESACQATTDGIQLLGGVGYMKDFGQEKRFRDAKHIQTLLGIAPMKKIKFIDNMIS
jgi:alkylation response protein AidB-like acyl-CoA dehydrogenase